MNILNGPDGNKSSRKIMGIVAFVVGIAFAIWAMLKFPPPDRDPIMWDALVFLPSVFFIIMSMYINKIITDQAIKTFIPKKEA